MAHENLYEFALNRSRESAEKRELTKVSEETGLDYSWLHKFSRNLIPGASYERVSKLAEYYQSRSQAAA